MLLIQHYTTWLIHSGVLYGFDTWVSLDTSGPTVTTSEVSATRLAPTGKTSQWGKLWRWNNVADYGKLVSGKLLRVNGVDVISEGSYFQLMHSTGQAS